MELAAEKYQVVFELMTRRYVHGRGVREENLRVLPYR